MRVARCVMTVVGAGVGLWLATAAPKAHHAFLAEFDANQPIELHGTVLKMEWINPHSWMHMEVKRPDGKVEQWEVELGPPNALFRRGWKQNSLPPGTAVVIQGYRAKDPKLMRVSGRDALLPDGRKLFMGSTDSGAPDFPKKPGA